MWFFRCGHRQKERLCLSGLTGEGALPTADSMHSQGSAVPERSCSHGLRHLSSLSSYSSHFYIPSSGAFIPRSLYWRPWAEVLKSLFPTDSVFSTLSHAPLNPGSVKLRRLLFSAPSTIRQRPDLYWSTRFSTRVPFHRAKGTGSVDIFSNFSLLLIPSQ